MIAGQKADTLAGLAEGEAEETRRRSAATEAELLEMAGYVNSRNNIIAALALLLALSVVTNVVFLVTR